jgi:hypothetical protein
MATKQGQNVLFCMPNRTKCILLDSVMGPQGADLDAFNEVAKIADDLDFYKTTSAAVAEAGGLKAHGIVIHRDFGSGAESVVFEGKEVTRVRPVAAPPPFRGSLTP